MFLGLFFPQMICLLEKVEYWNHLLFMKLSSSINLIPSACLLWTEVTLFRVSIVAIKMGRKGFVLLRCSHCSQSSKESEGRNLKAGTEAQAMVDWCLRYCFSCLVHSAFFCHPERLAQGWHCPKWSGPSHIHQQSRQHTADEPTGQSYAGVFSVESPYFQMTLANFKETKN